MEIELEGDKSFSKEDYYGIFQAGSLFWSKETHPLSLSRKADLEFSKQGNSRPCDPLVLVDWNMSGHWPRWSEALEVAWLEELYPKVGLGNYKDHSDSPPYVFIGTGRASQVITQWESEAERVASPTDRTSLTNKATKLQCSGTYDNPVLRDPEVMTNLPVYFWWGLFPQFQWDSHLLLSLALQ